MRLCAAAVAAALLFLGARAEGSAERAVDCAVIGGGVMGAAIASAAGRGMAGRSVLLLDQHGPGHTEGSSHGDGRIFRYAYSEANYAALAQIAERAWRDLEGRTNSTLMLRGVGGLDIGLAGRRELRGVEACLRSLGREPESLGGAELAAWFPQFRLGPGERAVHSRDSCVLHADRCVAALWADCEAHGVRALQHTAVRGVRKSAGAADFEVLLAEGPPIRARSVVLACGAWTPKLLPDEVAGRRLLPLPRLEVSCETVVHYGVKERFRSGDGDGGGDGDGRVVANVAGAPLSHGWEAMPIFIVHADNGLGAHGYYGLPAVDVPGVKVSAHYCGPPVDPDSPRSFDALAAPARDRVLRAVASADRLVERLFPHLDAAAKEKVAHCLYTSTPDHDFLIGSACFAEGASGAPGGRAEAVGGLFVAAGFSGHGFKFAAAVGELVALQVADFLGADCRGCGAIEGATFRGRGASGALRAVDTRPFRLSRFHEQGDADGRGAVPGHR